MEYLLTAEEMKSCDGTVIRHYQVPSLVLMERAALALTELLVQEQFDLSKTLVVCGSGNNGGDGFAVARILKLRKTDAAVWFVGNEASLTEEADLQKKICENYQVEFVRNPVLGEYTTIVDAIFGVGLSREVSGRYAEIIEKINASGTKVLAADIPSGVSASDGQILGTAIRADVTGALAFRKFGHLLYPGAGQCGKVHTLEIGITEEGFGGQKPRTWVLGREVLSFLPVRFPDSNKGSFGKACMFAGSRDMAGAAYLSSKAAYYTGCGLMRIVSRECNRTILQTLLPEAVMTSMEELELKKAEEALAWASAAGIGPGIGTVRESESLVKAVLEWAQIPVLMDADALNILAKNPSWLMEERKAPLVLTPHLGEMSRLTGLGIGELKRNLPNVCREYAKKWKAVLVLKDSRTLISDGDALFVNERGTDGMATGGSGDVLSGIITGFLAQGVAPLQAACLGVYLHACAGERAEEKKGKPAMLAGDILNSFGEVMKEGRTE